MRAEAQQGELITYRPYDRAVVRAPGRYIKIFRPGRAAVAAGRCPHLDILLAAGTFTIPRILSRRSRDVIVFSAIPGPALYESGGGGSTTGDETFAGAWEKWSHAWVAQLNRPQGPAGQSALDGLPLHSAELEATTMWRMVNLWLHHNENVPEPASQRDALRAAGSK